MNAQPASLAQACLRTRDTIQRAITRELPVITFSSAVQQATELNTSAHTQTDLTLHFSVYLLWTPEKEQ
jgi:hypothetical protein